MKQHILIHRKKIQHRVARLAARISADYQDKDPILIGVLNGAFIFMADLIRHIAIPVRIDFIKVSSYGPATASSGKVKVLLDIARPIKGKDVLIVEDIVDTGLTINHIRRMLLRQKPRSIKICALLDKPSRRKMPVKIDYRGFRIPDRFVVGYGLDYNENYRSLPDIRYLE